MAPSASGSEHSCSVPQSCPTPCDPMDCSPPASSVHGILQARILEWVATFFARGSSQPWDRTHLLGLLHGQVDSLPLGAPGKPQSFQNPTFLVSVLNVWSLNQRHQNFVGGEFHGRISAPESEPSVWQDCKRMVCTFICMVRKQWTQWT